MTGDQPRDFPPPLAGEGRGGGLDLPPPLAGEGRGGGYYDYPVVRRPVWTWEVPAYFWLGGMAAGAFVTASVAQTVGSADDRRIAADGYYLAVAAIAPCAPLLIADLGRADPGHGVSRLLIGTRQADANG